MNPVLNYHASQARIEEMRRLSEPLQDVQREPKVRARRRIAGLFSTLTSKSRPASLPTSAPATHKA